MPSPAANSPYSNAFYDHQAPGSARSATAVLPLVFELLQPSSMVDVGCGIGTWASTAKSLGCQVTGLDGAHVPVKQRLLSAAEFIETDLSRFAGMAGFAWLAGGGLFYTLGIVFYAIDTRMAHAHGIWHLFVIAGSATHYFAVLRYVV